MPQANLLPFIALQGTDVGIGPIRHDGHCIIDGLQRGRGNHCSVHSYILLFAEGARVRPEHRQSVELVAHLLASFQRPRPTTIQLGTDSQRVSACSQIWSACVTRMPRPI